jgi:hypothetical protein
MKNEYGHKILVKKAVKRKVGYLYWIDEGGNLWEENMIEHKEKEQK